MSVLLFPPSYYNSHALNAIRLASITTAKTGFSQSSWWLKPCANYKSRKKVKEIKINWTVIRFICDLFWPRRIEFFGFGINEIVEKNRPKCIVWLYVLLLFLFWCWRSVRKTRTEFQSMVNNGGHSVSVNAFVCSRKWLFRFRKTQSVSHKLCWWVVVLLVPVAAAINCSEINLKFIMRACACVPHLSSM